MKYEYKGNIYTVIGSCMMKDPVSREWRKAVLYSQSLKVGDEYHMGADIFCREETEFKERFKQIS